MPNVPNIATVKLIPADHTFFDMHTFLTIKANEMATNLLKQAQDRCPDMFDMYIYNDFWAYGVFDLVDKTLAKLNTNIKKKAWKEAFIILEALILFVECEGIWTQCDDGDRVGVTAKAIGAAAFAVFQGLEKSADFNTSAYPSLESLSQSLCKACKEGMVCDMDYEPVFRGIARRLLAGKTEADFTREREMLEEWVRGLEDDDEEMDEDDEDEDEDEDEPRGKKGMQKALKRIAEEQAAAKAAGKPITPWFAEGKVTTKVPNDLKFTGVWKDYKDYLADCPNTPLKGPAKWDLTTWTAAEKKPFQFGDGSDSD